jgi:hypothetical protein
MQLSRLRIRCLLPALALVAAMPGHAQDAGTVTLLRDTPLRVVRGVAVLQGVEGMRLRQGDYLETGPTPTSQAQLEFPDGAILELGPSSRVFLYSLKANSAAIVVVGGWLKGETRSGSWDFISHLASVSTKSGSILLHVTQNAADAFIEHGAAQVSAGSPAPIASSAEKMFFTRRAGKPAADAGRPSAEFVGAMPVSFRDVLPPRLDQFAGKKPPEPKTEREAAWSDVEGLLTAPASSRRGLVERFKPRLNDRAFREAIEAHIAELPEWKPALAAKDQSSGAATTN